MILEEANILIYLHIVGILIPTYCRYINMLGAYIIMSKFKFNFSPDYRHYLAIR